MKMSFVKQVGKNKLQFTVEGADIWECQMEAQKVALRSVVQCGKCGAENLYLKAYKTKEKNFRYIKIVCSKCRASVTFGKRQDQEGVYYLRKGDAQDGLDWQDAPPKEVSGEQYGL